MNFEQLRIITILARERQFSKAANRLHMTASAVSQAVSKLEDELGMLLFQRSKKNTSPTTDGQYVIRIAYIILEKRQEIYDYTTTRYPARLKIKIGAIPGIIDRLIHSFIFLQQEFPLIELEMIELNTQELVRHLREEKIDIAFLGFSETLTSYHLPYEIIKLTDGAFYCAVSEQSSLANSEEVSYQQIVHYPLALYQDSFILNFANYMKHKTVLPPRILFETNNMGAIIQSVNQNIAITIAPSYALYSSFHEYLPHVKVIPLENDPEALHTSLWFLRLRDQSLEPLSQLLLSLVKQELHIMN
ncbi:MAG: LysR family transcriptional regulator [Sporolactobacillus sp.]